MSLKLLLTVPWHLRVTPLCNGLLSFNVLCLEVDACSMGQAVQCIAPRACMPFTSFGQQEDNEETKTLFTLLSLLQTLGHFPNSGFILGEIAQLRQHNEADKKPHGTLRWLRAGNSSLFLL